MTESLADGPEWHLRSRFCAVKMMRMSNTNLTSQEPLSERSSPVLQMTNQEPTNKIFRYALHSNTTFNEMCFLNVDPLVGVPVFIAKLSELSLSRMYPILWHAIASTCVCTSPLAVVTILGLHDSVKVSISAFLKSCMLIMCIDAPESTTNSLSSGFNVDAGRHVFSGDEKNATLSCSFNLNIFLANFHAASRAPCPCHSVSSCERSSNFGALASLTRFTWTNVTERRFWPRIVVWRAIAFLNFTRWIGLGMSVLFRRIDFGGFMSWNSQPNCRASKKLTFRWI